MENQIKTEMERDQRLNLVQFLFSVLTEASVTAQFSDSHADRQETALTDPTLMTHLDHHRCRGSTSLIFKRRSRFWIVSDLCHKLGQLVADRGSTHEMWTQLTDKPF